MTIVVRQTVVESVRVQKQTMTRVMPLYYMRIRLRDHVRQYYTILTDKVNHKET